MIKNVIIVDIDGTLSKVGPRVLCLEKKPPDWNEFYLRCGEDEPVPEIIHMVNSLFHHYRIVICTGRRESCRETTKEWFRQHDLFNFESMLMRGDKDFRHDVIVKPELLAKNGIELSEIAFVLEDRNTMVKKWRELGLICLQVFEGDY